MQVPPSIPQSGSLFLEWCLPWEEDWAGRREKTLSFFMDIVDAGMFRGPALNALHPHPSL